MKQQLRNLIMLLAVAALSLAAASAMGAVPEQGAQLGLVGGPSVPDAENTNQYLLFGLKGSAFILPHISAGGYYLMSSKGDPVAPDFFKYSLHGLQLAYVMDSGESGETTMGIRAGITKVHSEPNAAVGSITYSPYNFGVFAGYDYLVYPWLLVGYEGSYMHVQQSRSNVNGTIYNRGSFNVINFLVSLQIRL